MCFFWRRKKVGLVLGSGGAMGMAHVGVIRALVRNKIPIDFVVGSSIGALVGGLFASSGRVDELESLMKEITYKDMARILFDFNWGGGLVKGQKTLEFLNKLFSSKKVEDLKIPFAAVATDLYTAEPVVFKRGDIAGAIRASISVPLVYSPVFDGDHLLVDGGVSCPVPVEVAREMGAEVVVAVNLDGVYFLNSNYQRKEQSSVIDVIKDSYFALRYNLAKKEVAGADVVIEPEMKYVEMLDIVSGKETIEQGERAAEKVMRKIKKLVR